MKLIVIKELIIYKVVQQNDFDAQFILEIIYITHPVIVKNIPKTMHYMTLYANQNNSSTQFTLGLYYFMGIHVLQDKNKAIYII